MMEEDLETTIKKESFFKEAYKQEWRSMIQNLIAAGVAITVAATTTYIAKNYYGIESDEALTGMATTADLITYWTTLYSQFIYSDVKKARKEIKKVAKKTKYIMKEAEKKVFNYSWLFLAITGSYALFRPAGQYFLQKEMGVDPVAASTITQGALTIIYTLSIPLIKHSGSRTSDKVFKG